MKSILKVLSAATMAVIASSCSSFLDINDNPNTFTTANPPTPNFILAQALAATASNYSIGYNSYSMWAVDYVAKSGIVSGYAAERTYNYSSSYYQSLWTSTYDNLNDYNVIQLRAPGLNYPYHAAIARIMKAYNYLLLVDQYGNIPYSESLKGLDNLTPKYDDAATIYKDLIVQLSGAIADINTANTLAGNPATAPIVVGPEDIVFQGNMTNWKRFANSLKLRILLRASSTSDASLNTYVQQQMTALQTSASVTTDGYIQTDVMANPGYVQSSGQQNPFYNRYGVQFTGTSSATERFYQVPTRFVLRAYLNNVPATAPNTSYKYTAGISDPRTTQLYSLGKLNGTSVYLGSDAGEPNPPLVSSLLTTYAARFALGGGILKGFNAPTPLMLLSEHLFNKSEAEARGLLTNGDARADYKDGMLASFLYFYRPAATASSTIANAASAAGYSQYTAYVNGASAQANPNVNFDLALTTTAKQNVILYQKYLAENVIAATEAWDDYRRTLQPKIEQSLQSSQGRLPSRLFYPLVEVNTNTTNVPQGVTQYTKLFWANL